MRKLICLLSILSIVLLALPLQTTLAQSSGCVALGGYSGIVNPSFSLGARDFSKGDRIVVEITGTGTNFSLLANGSTVAGPGATGTSLSYSIPEDGSYRLLIEATGTDATSTATVTCTPGAETFPPGMLCHIPPGNPNAAHTITVGEAAVEAHLKHGDTLGPCSRSRQTKFDDYEAGVAIFIISATGEISIWGNCDGDKCEGIVVTTVVELIDLNSIIFKGPDGDHFIQVDNPEAYRFVLPEDEADGEYLAIYYLHPDPNNDQVGVFQLNFYRNNTLVSDKILIFIDLNGNIVQWTTHDYWIEMLQKLSQKH